MCLNAPNHAAGRYYFKCHREPQRSGMHDAISQKQFSNNVTLESDPSFWVSNKTAGAVSVISYHKVIPIRLYFARQYYRSPRHPRQTTAGAL
jgi:hypothetical protein